MTTSQTTNLHLTKAVKGTAEPFSIDAVNANLDTIDSAVGAVGNTDLQSQITELKSSLNGLIKCGVVTSSQTTVPANGYASITINSNTPSGYTNLGYRMVDISNWAANVVAGLDMNSSSSVTVRVKNTTSSVETCVVSVEMIYVKTAFYAS